MAPSSRWVAVALSALMLASSCASGAKSKRLRKQAALDLTCPEGQVRLSTLNKQESQYLAEACGRKAVFTYAKETGAVRISAIEGIGTDGKPLQASPVEPGPAPTGNSSETPPPPPPPPPPQR